MSTTLTNQTMGADPNPPLGAGLYVCGVPVR